jgi:patatin-like phospholipase/acyl hydrolase
MKKRRLIVSIDGGGIRGILPLMILSQLNRLVIKERLGSCINDKIDYAAGTSTGAIIAASMLLKSQNRYVFLPENILNLYVTKGPQLFDVHPTSDRKPQALNSILEATFGKIKLKDLPTYFSFVSYDINQNEPFIFVNNSERLREISLAKALAACSAIPGYFAPIEVDSHKLVDGIETNKNPSFLAYKNAKMVYPDDVLVMWSFGTGQLTGENYDDIEKRVDDTHNEMIDIAQQDKHFIYHRLQPELRTADQAMDNASPENIQSLMDDAEYFLKYHEKRLSALIEEFKNIRAGRL